MSIPEKRPEATPQVIDVADAEASAPLLDPGLEPPALVPVEDRPELAPRLFERVRDQVAARLPPELRARFGQVELEDLVEGARTLAPEQVRALTRRTRAELRARALDLLPLPLYEVWRLGSFDPFVVRAATLSHRTSGRHFLILAGLPMTDSGGGHRAAQLAHELLHHAHRVTYVYRFSSREHRRRRRSFAHENLTHVRFDEFSARRFALERGSRERVFAVVEAPLPEYRACARYLRTRGAVTAYDCSADWAGPIGGAWYSRRAEDRLLREVDAVLAASEVLKNDLEKRSGRQAALMPNAVNSRVFARGRAHERPRDLPQAEAIFTYVGSLRGAWFDWELVVRLARANPRAAVVLVGDYRGQCRQPPPNLHFLGLRSQAEVPGYLAHSDVCLLPYRSGPGLDAASPLKVYEYLAMGRPVVATDLPGIRGLPGVLLARDADSFVGAAEQARRLNLGDEELARFVSENSWKARVRLLERMLGA